MVRRSAMTNLGKFDVTLEAPHLKVDIMSMFNHLTHDDQDCVGLLAVEDFAALGKLLEPQYKSCRVRYMVVNQLYELCEVVGPEPTSNRVLPNSESRASYPENSYLVSRNYQKIHPSMFDLLWPHL
ncbi:hypothetical protein V6N13_043327 [Hibiscus sabdariffa]